MASQAIPLLYETDSMVVLTKPFPSGDSGPVAGGVYTVDNRPKLNLVVPAPGAPQISSVIRNPA